MKNPTYKITFQGGFGTVHENTIQGTDDQNETLAALYFYCIGFLNAFYSSDEMVAFYSRSTLEEMKARACSQFIFCKKMKLRGRAKVGYVTGRALITFLDVVKIN